MDYEKAYKEALSKAKTYCKRWDGIDVDSSSLVIKEVKKIFPELAESEDEKIRKEIIENIRQDIELECTLPEDEGKRWIAFEKQGKCEIVCNQSLQSSGHPKGSIVLEDFNGGEGFYKLHLNYLNKRQVEEVEEMVRMWNKETSNDIIKACIGMCLTDADEQRFKDYNTNLKDCLAWLETHKYTEEDLDKAYKCADKVQYMSGYNDAKEEIEKQGEEKPF